MFSKEEMQQEREKAMQYYGIANDATDEEIRDCVYRNLVIPSYEEFKHALFEHIKEVGIKDTKEDVIDVFDPDSYIYQDAYYNDNDGIVCGNPSDRWQVDIVDFLFHLNCSDGWQGVENLYTDLEGWFFSVVAKSNMLYAFDDDEMNDIHSVSDNMPTELEDRTPLIIFERYIERMGKEDLQELKDLIMSLA